MSRRNTSVFAWTLFTTASLIGLNAQAQTTETVDQDPQVLDEVLVQGYRGSLASSLERKRNADQIIDVITAEDIGQFPEQNLTESIQRIAVFRLPGTTDPESRSIFAVCHRPLRGSSWMVAQPT